MDYRKITRRIFIGLGAIIALCFFAAIGGAAWIVRRECKRNHSIKDNPVPDDHFRNVMGTRFDSPDLYNLDVVTVDSTSAIITWATAKESKFRLENENDSSGIQWKEEVAPTRFHMAELNKLAADTEYSFRLIEQGGGVEERIGFCTLPDAGKALFRFGTFSDNHCKPDGITWPDGRLFRRCSDIHKCLITDLNATNPDFLINKGDLTDSYEPYRLRVYSEAVSGLKPPTHSIPGNHDHLMNKNFTADWIDFAGTEQVYRSFDHKGIHFVLLDTSWTGEQERGFLGKKQISWLVDDLEQNASKRTLIFTHHPVNGDVEENRVAHDYIDFQKAIAQFPNVVAVFSAHVHRNYVTTSDLTPEVPYIETASVIQYPIGYNLYEVTTTGVKQVFKKLSDVSLSEESWLASPLRCLTNPGDALGKLSDRNFFIPFKTPITSDDLA